MCVCVCGSLQQNCLPGKSANYNIKAVSTSDLFAFALYAVTLNQERSAVNVGLMQKLSPHLVFVQMDFDHSSAQKHIIHVALHWIWCLHTLL